METPPPHLPLRLDAPARYVLVFQGHIPVAWANELGGMQVVHGQDATGPVTRLTGTVRDQSALAGVLLRLIGNGYPLISVQLLGVEPPIVFQIMILEGCCCNHNSKRIRKR
jgi:hypothetical protein